MSSPRRLKPPTFAPTVDFLRRESAPFTGYRCDRPGCDAEIAGDVETPSARRALVLRAEAQGWQCVTGVDYTPLHFCAEHVEPTLPRRAVLR